MTTKKPITTKATTSASTTSEEKLRPLQKLSLFFFKRPKLTAGIAILILLIGVLSYTTLLKREGFPAINVPYAIGQGTYFVNDPEKLDQAVTKPLSALLLKDDSVSTVRTTSLGNFYTVAVQYKEGTDAATKTKELQNQVYTQKLLPAQATLQFDAAKFGVTQRGDDAVISFVSKTDPTKSSVQIAADAQKAVDLLLANKGGVIADASVIQPVETATNPLTGQAATLQTKFERFGVRENDVTKFYNAVPIGVTSVKGADALAFDDQLHKVSELYSQKYPDSGFEMYVSAGFAPSIRQQISELQKTLLEGLLAVLVVGSIVIAFRASILTVLSMIMVIVSVIGVLYGIGYTLNTITLFALILGLSLIVDDTIIMVEALDKQRQRFKNREKIVAVSVQKVGRAMIAATMTAALSFAPLLFVGGVLGGFIRAIPVTIISALIISLLVALIFIPFFARYILLGDKHLKNKTEKEFAAGFEASVARFISTPMLWAKNSHKKLALVIVSAFVISFAFIGAGGYLFSKVTFNIFPATKDANELTVTLSFPAGTTIEEAEIAADAAANKIGATLGENFKYAANYGEATAQQARFVVNLTDYNSRKPAAPELVLELEKAFVGFTQADVEIAPIDLGPPASAFSVRIETNGDRAAAQRLAEDMAKFLETADIRRIDDSKIAIDKVTVANTDTVTRADGAQYVGVTATFIDTDTTTLVNQTKAAIEKEFDAAKVESYGLNQNAVVFDFGQEAENQDSFKSMIIAFPILLGVIYLLLAFQFRSLLQPILIFMAIPFSLFGITLGLYLTDNAFSFFAMLGFFALIGLSIKNTILLTDYANQSRRAGMGAVDAAHEALAERFRPLIATSLTAVVSLIPLAVSSPFWQGLSVVLIFGLLSSTFLVVIVFPYYYIAGEFARAGGKKVVQRVKRGR